MSCMTLPANSRAPTLTIGELTFPLCGESAAVDFARVLLGCFRKIDAADVDVYTRAVVATLASYPAFAAQAACDPLRGLPSRLKWSPSIAELRQACERELEPLRQDAARRARAAQCRRSPPRPEAERQRVADGFRALTARLG